MTTKTKTNNRTVSNSVTLTKAKNKKPIVLDLTHKHKEAVFTEEQIDTIQMALAVFEMSNFDSDEDVLNEISIILENMLPRGDIDE